mmetsp:Transcript_19539/g.30609  ORF Transcript_19539/g.30609 Transcript_19539/m.30609 type:complete len:243 (-) Transcript_19539:24-752(-)
MAEVEEESIGKPNPYNLCCISLHPSSRVELWKSLDLRCEKMIEQGLLREVKELLEVDREGTVFSLGSAIGYRETIQFLDWVDKELGHNGRRLDGQMLKGKFLEYLERFQITTRQLVRKQTCWIRQTEHPFTVIKQKGLCENVSEILCTYNSQIPSKSLHYSIENEDKKKTRTYTSQNSIFKNSSKIFETLSSQIGLSLKEEKPQTPRKRKQNNQKIPKKKKGINHSCESWDIEGYYSSEKPQ